jgi:hypothetical protein
LFFKKISSTFQRAFLRRTSIKIFQKNSLVEIQMYREAVVGFLLFFLIYILTPPTPFNDRLDKIDENKVKIDNLYYGLPHFATSWWQSDSWAQGLHALNPTRTEYILELLKNKQIPTNSSIVDVGNFLIF